MNDMLARSTMIDQQRQRQKVVQSLEDKDCYLERLQEMKVPLTPNQIAKYTARKEAIDAYLEDIGLQVNNNQFGCAVAATYDSKKPRTILAVPSGKGKSRIMAAVIALKYDYAGTREFTILYSSELLKSADHDKFEKLRRLLVGSRIRQVAYSKDVPIGEQVDPNDFLLVDEADTIFLDNAQVPANRNIVGLSATVVSPGSNLEHIFISHHRFHCMDSKIPGFIDPNQQLQKVTVDQFIAKSVSSAKLVYVPDEAIDSYRKAAAAKITSVNCRELAQLKRLTRNDYLVVTDAELMRGVDYRVAPGTQGISLLIMGAFASTRAYVQGLGRVGRYNEKCQRFLWSELGSPIDKDSQTEIFGKLKQGVPSSHRGANNRSQQLQKFVRQMKLEFGQNNNK